MAIGFSTGLRNSRNDAIGTATDAGTGAGKARIYDGTRPATGGTATTLLFETAHSDPSYAASSGGVLTANAITADASANATGTATWGRELDSDDNFLFDFDVGESGSGADLILVTTAIVAGTEQSITSFVITDGNP
jgi:hypothetical protein